MLNLDKLATLRAVVAHGSFSAAGEALALTQPAVSRQISLLERQLGTQLVRRSRQGVLPTESGRLLVRHADVILGRIALAEAEIAELTGLRRGHVRLGSFFSALIHLSTDLAVLLEERHPDLFRSQPDVIQDHLVDRRAAFQGLAAGELDVAIVCEHAFEPEPAPAEIELIPLYDDPPQVLLPAGHQLARAPSASPGELAEETWVRAHHGSAARLVDHVLAGADLRPRLLLAGHGDEPVEAQAFIAAGRGVTVAHALNMLISHERMSVVPLAGGKPVRHIQAAIMRDQRAPLPRAVVDALRDVGRDRARR